MFCGPAAGLIARYGTTLSAIVSGSMAFLGATIVCAGISSTSFDTVMIGRLVFALFVSLLHSVQTIIIFEQFKGPKLSLLFSLKIVASRIGAVSGFYFSGSLLTYAESLSVAMYIASTFCGISLLCTFAFAYLYRGSKTARLIRPLMTGRQFSYTDEGVDNLGENDGESTVAHREHDTTSTTHQGDGSILFQLPVETWTCCVVIFWFYAGLIPLETFGVEYLQQEFGLDKLAAGKSMSLVPFFAVFSPILSVFLRSGKNLMWTQLLLLLAAELVAIIALFCLGMDFAWAPNLYLALIGIGYMD